MPDEKFQTQVRKPMFLPLFPQLSLMRCLPATAISKAVLIFRASMLKRHPCGLSAAFSVRQGSGYRQLRIRQYTSPTTF